MRAHELRRIRADLKMSQAEMAAALGLKHKSQIHYMETGRFMIRGPAEAAVRQLAAAGKPIEGVRSFSPAEVKRIRQALGLTQKQMADALGLSQPAQVAHLESGRTAVNWAKAILLKRLAEKTPPKKTAKP